jgi:hypothetical protein
LAAAFLLSGVGCMFVAPRKAWKTVDDFRGVRRYVFSDSVVEGQSVNLETRRRWTTFRSYEEARDGYRLWESGSNSWIAIPKRSFVTAADQSAFWRLVAEKVGTQSHSESSRQSPSSGLVQTARTPNRSRWSSEGFGSEPLDMEHSASVDKCLQRGARIRNSAVAALMIVSLVKPPNASVLPGISGNPLFD